MGWLHCKWQLLLLHTILAWTWFSFKILSIIHNIQCAQIFHLVGYFYCYVFFLKLLEWNHFFNFLGFFISWFFDLEISLVWLIHYNHFFFVMSLEYPTFKIMSCENKNILFLALLEWSSFLFLDWLLWQGLSVLCWKDGLIRTPRPFPVFYRKCIQCFPTEHAVNYGLFPHGLLSCSKFSA